MAGGLRAALVAFGILVLAPAPAHAYKLYGFKFSQRTVTYHNTAHKFDAGVKAAAKAWNRSGVRLRLKAAPRSRADVVIRINRRLATQGVAYFQPRGGRVHGGLIEVRHDLRTLGSTPGQKQALITFVMAHEMGHLMGLNHEDRRCATMNSTGWAACSAPKEPWRYRCRTLERDDVRGAVALYGGRVRPIGQAFCATEPQPAAPTELTTTTVATGGGAVEVRVSWRSPAGADRVRVLSRPGTCPTGPDDNRASFIGEVSKPRAGQIETVTDYQPSRGCYAAYALGRHGRPSAPVTFLHLGLPVADFDFQAIGGNVVVFSSDSADDRDVVSGMWDFGDGTTSDEAFPEHEYATPGPWTVTLTVTDDEGNTASVSKVVQAG